MKLYNISSEYINYLRSDPKLRSVEDNKEAQATQGRKYLGAVIKGKNINYFVPLSTPKDTDYKVIKGKKEIRSNCVPIWRITAKNKKTGKLELKGTLRFSGMIPVPKKALIPCVFMDIKDKNYRKLIFDEFDYIKNNYSKIKNNAKKIYEQKTDTKRYFKNRKVPEYLNNTIDFKYAEQKYLEYCKEHKIEMYEERQSSEQTSSMKQQQKDIKPQSPKHFWQER